MQKLSFIAFSTGPTVTPGCGYVAHPASPCSPHLTLSANLINSPCHHPRRTRLSLGIEPLAERLEVPH
ncbi:MAG TPA: hypothetical protein V6C57_26350, partial [Coleofasciculaceae cyanobacterium]